MEEQKSRSMEDQKSRSMEDQKSRSMKNQKSRYRKDQKLLNGSYKYMDEKLETKIYMEKML